MSELFVDTELDADDLRHIARKLADTGYSLEALDRMHEDEVAPVCNWAFAPVGPWPAFDPEWLVEAIERRRARWRPAWWRALWRGWWTRSSRAQWRVVRAEIALARGPSGSG